MMDSFPAERVTYEGSGSRNPLAFKHYDRDAVVAGRTMADWLRFGCAYWHTMRGNGADPFGGAVHQMPWDDGSDSIENAQRRARVFFDFLDKVSIDYYCFHDRDVAPEGKTLKESNANLDAVVKVLAEEQKARGKKLLWGTASLFTHPRYMHGAATSPSADVFAYAAAQVKKVMEVTHALDGQGFVFWGGREGYNTLLNTDMKREREHLARFFHMAVDYKKKIGFKGQFYIEPKPQEPTTHQYDSDAEACLNFLREFDLMDHLKLNIETNHATLAGHTMEHELTVAMNAGALGSIDANMGTPNVGWDTDEFPLDIYLTTKIMLVVMQMGGFTTGGLNFDAKRRRESFEPIDLVHAHVAGMDTFARGLKVAAKIHEEGRFAEFIKQRYASFDSGIGAEIESGRATFESLEKYALEKGEPKLESGRQEVLQALFNEYI